MKTSNMSTQIRSPRAKQMLINTFILAINKNEFFFKKTNEKKETYLYEIKSPAQGDKATVMSLWVMSLWSEEEKVKWGVCDGWCEYDGKSQELWLVG